ncbi:MAG TPA: acyltransferase family protein [Steroidobacteraceae bacterium]|nr:acyltransferase family protein [Steroidobacteraceae bacterium]
MARAAEAYRPDIDGLRALAVTLVIAYHVCPQVLPGGFSGVDVFFVISGFLITRLVLDDLSAGRFSLRRFYARRVRRIVPALLLVLASCWLVGWFVLLPGEFRWFGASLLWCAPFLANVFFAHATGYFDPATDANVLLHLWSLGVEEQFYLLWPLLLLLAARARVVTPVLLAVFASSLAISVLGARIAPVSHFFLPGPRAWELTAGGLLALRALGGAAPWSPPWAARAALCGLALILAGATLLSANDTFPGLWGLVPVGGALLLIGAGPGTPLNRLFGSRPLVRLGQLSYVLYLWHWPVLAFVRIVWGREPSALMLAGALAITALLAWLTHQLLEQPLRHGAWGARAVPALLAGLAGFTLLGAATAAGRLPGRLSGAAFSSWEAATIDWHIRGAGDVEHMGDFETLHLRSARRTTTLFIGDSHLQQYWPRVTAVVDAQPRAARSVLFAAYAGCPMLPGLNALRQPRDCDRFFAYATAQAWQPQVDTVVFGAFWELYLLGEYSLEREHGVYRTDDPLRRRLRLDSPATAQAFAHFARLLSALTASGRRVFIVLSNPTSPRFEPVALVPAALRLGLSVPAQFRAAAPADIDAASYEDFVAPLMSRLRALAVQSGAQVLDPRTTLCSGMRCPAVGADGTPLYIDSNHLRASYARAQASFLDATLLGDGRRAVANRLAREQ